MPASIDDVAAAAQVSTATVSRAIRGLPRVSPATRARILAVAEDLGYVASPSASTLATGRTRTIGVLAPFADRWYFGRSIEGVERELREHSYNLLLFSLGGYARNREGLFNHNLVRKQIDALVVLCLSLSADELAHLHRTEIPLVAVGGPVAGCSSVRIDDGMAAEAATQHLLDLGHRDIGHLHGGSEDEMNFTVPRLRTDGFEAALRKSGVQPRPEWDVEGDYTVLNGVRAAARLFDGPSPMPTAVFCASDEMALGLMFEAHRRGLRVPEDLSIVGIDDHEFSEAAGLTTIRQDPTEHGAMAAQMLMAELAGMPGAIRDRVVPHRLIVRSTTAAPRR
ncbi:MAG: LacI family transcriptional regulator [Actinomycetota bacterium]|uniref:LacI family DNA-binding transcriptional regulator n=1 Tax=Micrococcaceae TaxID=1268 RepID=UPI0024B92329|nr:LacI family DNA-binding transcriptional regulator [Paenarthrobacter sp. PH39-S1]MDJ0354911.1 LacI family DNA-binding transcriptional regulator [Paenarthrobacter sp. PH39-S1]MDQ6739224.1 LacI family transcriptional regulator [Actinomycetota bacterium]